jgi:TRAP-type C4-dicarboxylate transport system permease large subunit
MSILFAIGRLALFGAGLVTGVMLSLGLFVWAYWLDSRKKEKPQAEPKPDAG